MHPDILWQLVAEHTRDPTTQAGEARGGPAEPALDARRCSAGSSPEAVNPAGGAVAPVPPGIQDPGHAGRGRPGRGVPGVLTNDPTTQHIRERNDPTQRRRSCRRTKPTRLAWRICRTCRDETNSEVSA